MIWAFLGGIGVGILLTVASALIDAHYHRKAQKARFDAEVQRVMKRKGT